jgi:ABC-type phosphonate transport system ATPase subunit
VVTVAVMVGVMAAARAVAKVVVMVVEMEVEMAAGETVVVAMAVAVVRVVAVMAMVMHDQQIVFQGTCVACLHHPRLQQPQAPHTQAFPTCTIWIGSNGMCQD